MVITKSMTNLNIYNIANAIGEFYNGLAEKKTPLSVKANFYFQKNMNILFDLAKEIEEERVKIIKKFGVENAEDPNLVDIAPENVETVNKELEDLFSLEQDVKVYKINLDWFDSVDMTPQEFTAISYMIEDEE